MADDELAVDPNVAAEEVDPVDRESEAFALAEPHTGGEDDQRPVAVWDGVGEGTHDLGDAERYDLGVGSLRQRDADAG